MKLAILLGGFLLVTFGRHAESRYYSNWEELECMSERLEAEAERIEQEAEARERQLEAEEEAREKELEAEEEDREKQFQAELDELRRKCAKKGFSNGDYPNVISTSTNSIDGFRHIYVHGYNRETKKISGSYYRINQQNSTAEPICGKLEIGQASFDRTNKYQNEEEFAELGQKCAARGFPYDVVGTEHMAKLVITVDGIRHLYLQSYNYATKKVSGNYFGTNHINGELTCGKLVIESMS